MPPLLHEQVCEAANAVLNGKSHIKVLEAGCGSASRMRFNAGVHTVGIDISEEELAKNTAVHDRILGDIQDYPLPSGEFDVVVCWMVLEHLSRPRDALANLFRAVKPGGLVILAFPNPASIKGIVTKFTPFWFHRAFYRVMRYKSRHFPTYLRSEILPERVIRLAKENGFSLAFYRLAEGNVPKKFRERFKLANLAFPVIDSVGRLVSLGRWQTALLDECAIVIQKNE